MSEEKKEAKKVEKVDKKAFINRKLKALNNMPNKAKAKALADKVLNNK